MPAHLRPILLIAYDYAPEISGVRRIHKLMRWLPEFGWRPTLLTTTPFSATGYDLDPLREAEERGWEIIRVPSPDPFHVRHRVELPNPLPKRENEDHLVDRAGSPARSAHSQRPAWQRELAALARRFWYIPDERRGWVAPAAKAATDWLRAHPGSPFLSTSFPHSCHLVGLQLRSEFGAREHPWIADFRDGWTQNADFGAPPNSWAGRRHARLEREVATRATIVTTASPPITEHLKAVGGRDGEVGSRPTATILNGYEPEEMEYAHALSVILRQFGPPDRFILTYTGTLFGRRRAAPLLAGFAELTRRDESWRKRLLVNLLTRLRPEEIEQIKSLGLAPNVFEWGLCSHAGALQAQASADALLLAIAPGPNAHIMMTQKVFEYLATGLPIVAVIPPGACRDLLAPFERALIVEPGDPVALADAIGRAAEIPRATEPPAELTRRAQIEKFARLLDATMARTNS